MNKRRKSKMGLLIMLCIFAYFAYIIIGQQKDLLEKQKEINEVKGKIANEEIVKKELDKKMESMNTKDYATQVAREELGLVKPGEKVYNDINK